eukprot:CAMPEP_0202338974 /NCGR_PEP_ID=MMETSP1126-20121109/1034_1 /ASSEMBLY_ACC=CAM_ASM_000457 /TAXON_ID=3047 /ORGANISM="Dunaliella tertiolecta, Strain CCMP1320" /LENGTH=134 /DNA_ID=CAMNT_0048929457 /DNA_START=333 /DNA_END=735 /DNA_ORIENTATION=+
MVHKAALGLDLAAELGSDLDPFLYARSLPASVDFTLISHSWASSWQVQLCEDAAPLPADWTGHTPAAASLCDLANELSKVGRGAHSGGAPAAASFPALSPQVVADNISIAPCSCPLSLPVAGIGLNGLPVNLRV